nr:APC family permease [Sulfobacillus harzensis]
MRTPEVLFLGINGVIGGGIFLLPGQVSQAAGRSAIWAYLAAGIIAIFIGLAFSAVGRIVTRTGGPYVYAEEAFGALPGFAVGWMSWVTFVLGWAALTVGLVSYITQLVPALHGLKDVLIVVILALLCGLNSLGVRRGQGAVTVFSIAKLIPLALLIVWGLFLVTTHHSVTGGGAGGHFGQAVLLLIFAYGGFEMAAIPAGEMTNPKRAVGIGIIGTLAGVTVFYMLIQWASERLDPHIAHAAAPLMSAGQAMFIGGATVMAVGAAVAIFGTISGVALTAPRVLYALSLRRALPPQLAMIWQPFRTPVVAIWVTGIIVAVLAISGTFTHLIFINVAARLFEYCMVALAAVKLGLRRQTPEASASRPIWGVVVSGIAAVVTLALLTRESLTALLAAALALAVGLAIYGLAQLAARSVS